MRRIDERARSRRGFSLVELTIAAAIATVVLGAGVSLLSAGSEAARGAGGRLALDGRMETALERVTELLRATSADRVTVSAAAPEGSRWIQFQRVRGIVNSQPDYGPAERIALLQDPNDPIDGLDNDGDELVDEGEVVWIRDFGLASEERTVLARGVPAAGAGEILGNNVDDDGDGVVDEPGLAFTLGDGEVRVQLTLVAGDSTGRTVRRWSERAVDFRNRPLF